MSTANPPEAPQQTPISLLHTLALRHPTVFCRLRYTSSSSSFRETHCSTFSNPEPNGPGLWLGRRSFGCPRIRRVPWNTQASAIAEKKSLGIIGPSQPIQEVQSRYTTERIRWKGSRVLLAFIKSVSQSLFPAPTPSNAHMGRCFSKHQSPFYSVESRDVSSLVVPLQ